MNELLKERAKDAKIEIINMLKSAGRPGMNDLIDSMENGGFFTAPCSGKYHLCVEGGLAIHCLMVTQTLMSLCEHFRADVDKSSIIIAGLLHDLGKIGDYGKPNYVPKMVRSKSKNKETGEYDMVQSEAEPYETNRDLTYEEHEIRSVIIACRYIYLTEEEQTAILHHNGLYGKLDSSYGNANYCSTKLAFLLHTADMWCSRFSELEAKEDVLWSY